MGLLAEGKTPFYHHIAIAVRFLTADTRSMLYFYSHIDTSLSCPKVVLFMYVWKVCHLPH